MNSAINYSGFSDLIEQHAREIRELEKQQPLAEEHVIAAQTKPEIVEQATQPHQ